MRNEKIRVAIWGFGAMGSGMARMILNKEGFEIVGVCDQYEKIVGKSIFELLHVKATQPEVTITSDIDGLLEQEKPELVLLATDSFTAAAFPKIKRLIEHRCNVISTAEEMAFPYASEPELSKEMNRLAKEFGVTVLGTGVNPGMMMDLLAINLTGIMSDVQAFQISRVNSLSPFGKTVMEEQGVGFTVSDFKEKMDKHEIAGHVGFKESTHMIATALGSNIVSFEQTMSPIITEVDRKSPYGFAQKGDVCGVDMRCEAKMGNTIPIYMHHPQQIEPSLAGVSTKDEIIIKGTPSVHMTITPEIDGGIGTIAICVNMIPHVINSRPGLKTMIDLPVPRAIMGDVRQYLEEE